MIVCSSCPQSRGRVDAGRFAMHVIRRLRRRRRAGETWRKESHQRAMLCQVSGRSFSSPPARVGRAVRRGTAAVIPSSAAAAPNSVSFSVASFAVFQGFNCTGNRSDVNVLSSYSDDVEASGESSAASLRVEISPVEKLPKARGDGHEDGTTLLRRR